MPLIDWIRLRDNVPMSTALALAFLGALAFGAAAFLPFGVAFGFPPLVRDALAAIGAAVFVVGVTLAHDIHTVRGRRTRTGPSGGAASLARFGPSVEVYDPRAAEPSAPSTAARTLPRPKRDDE
jgi:hypothetical protein